MTKLADRTLHPESHERCAQRLATKTQRAIAVIGIGIALVASPACHRDSNDEGDLVLYGNVDIREVQLAFNGTERIAALHAREGQRVEKGEVLGELDKEALAANVARAEASVASQEQRVLALESGSRPEDIRKARADVAAARANVRRSRLNLARTEELVAGGAATRERLDDDQTATEVAVANLKASLAAEKLVLAGPREEDIMAARATRDALKADLVLARKALVDADLRAPEIGIIRDRLLEPGDMVSPRQPVYTLALTDPVWVRVYIEEKDLGRAKPGQRAYITTNSYPNKQYEGWLGYVSPTAEFTPKSVQTREVRSSLVYQARVLVCNPDGELRLGMPADVRLDIAQPPEPSPGCAEP